MKDKIIIEKQDRDNGVFIVKHGQESVKDFSKLPLRNLRASSIGRDCDTELFLSASGVDSQFEKKSLRIFEIGRVLEPVVAKWMREDGWEVIHNDDDSLGMILHAGPGIITGHPDIFARHPKITKNEWALLDIKTMNTRRYNTWSKNGTQSSDPSYYAQLLFYGYAWKYKKLGIVAIEKSSGDYSVEIFDFNRNEFKRLYERAREILDTDIATARQGKKCEWCSKKDSCSGIMRNEIPKIKDRKYMIDLIAHYYDAYVYTETENLIKISPKYDIEEMLIPADNVQSVFEERNEQENLDDWIIL